LPAFEDDGVTHRRDCDCARCDAGFGPSESERAEALRRWDEKKARAAAERAAARKLEGERIKRAEVDLFLKDQIRLTDQQLRSLRDLGSRVQKDPRLDELSRLRSKGMSLRDALAEIDQRFARGDQ
jgi:hypothetical protein